MPVDREHSAYVEGRGAVEAPVGQTEDGPYRRAGRRLPYDLKTYVVVIGFAGDPESEEVDVLAYDEVEAEEVAAVACRMDYEDGVIPKHVHGPMTGFYC